MLKIGLTGGIGCGKSTVAKYFRALQIPVLDADQITHELLKPDTKTFKALLTHFGPAILTPNNTIDRAKLRHLIFSNQPERLWVEALLHKQVAKSLALASKQVQAPYCILMVPLLLETRFPPKVDRILVVDCKKTTQVQRVRTRNNYPRKQILAILAAQLSRKERLKQANEVINNDKLTLGELQKAVKKLHNYYLSLT